MGGISLKHTFNRVPNSTQSQYDNLDKRIPKCELIYDMKAMHVVCKFVGYADAEILHKKRICDLHCPIYLYFPKLLLSISAMLHLNLITIFIQ